MKPLSRTQQDALEYAQRVAEQSPLTRMMHGGNKDGWFYAQFTTRGSIEFFCRPQTLESLFKRGLLEKRQTHYKDGYVFTEYRYPVSELPPPTWDEVQATQEKLQHQRMYEI